MATLQDLLVEEGRKFAKSQKKVKFKDADQSIALPIYICHDKKSFDFSKGKRRKDFARSEGGSSWQKGSSDSGSRSNRKSMTEEALVIRKDEPAAIDLVAIKAVISILSGYIGQYMNDKNFRVMIREKCCSCFVRKRNDDSDNGIFANMELGIESVERLVESHGARKEELRVKSLQYSIRLLSIVASLNSKSSKGSSTCGTPNSHLSACAQLYLAIVYKLEKNDRISARHLLQVFCDSPFLARTHLLPELWEHLFLPHLLHIKVWYKGQLEILANSNYIDNEMKMKALFEIYNDQMDFGTKQFSAYYKEWLKVGVQAPAVPTVPLPSKSYTPSRRRSSESYASQSSIKSKSLYEAVFGPTSIRKRQSLDMDFLGGVVVDPWGLKEEEKFYTHEENSKPSDPFEEAKVKAQQRTLSQSFTRSKNEFWSNFIGCKNEAIDPSVCDNYIAWDDSIKKVEDIQSSFNNTLYKACRAISISDDLSECEMAIRTIAKACLEPSTDPAIEKTLTEIQVIEGILEVLHASNDDEILELAVSILAELVTRNEKNAKTILNSDPQLDIFLNLLRNTSLFLKAAALLYLMQPKAKQMISMEWIPLVLRVLEFGDQLQTLFSVQCSPQVAAYYLLDQVLTGYEEDKISENARQFISLGGLSLLIRRMAIGDQCERDKAVSLIYYCVQADGTCKPYLVKHLNKNSILDLIAPGKDNNSHGHAFALLIELVCFHRFTQRMEFLRGLVDEKGSLNLVHILLVYLQRARSEERPMIAAVLLQLDLLGDPFEFSICREEGVEALIEALDCRVLDEKIQEQSAKALSILGGHFSYKGEPLIEEWLLRKAGFDKNSRNGSSKSKLLFQNEEDDVMENWQRKTALVLYTRGNKRFLSALSNAIANGIPCLERASLVTISWMSSFLHSLSDKSIQSVACSILVPRLVERLKDDKALEERILASFSLLNLMKSSDCASKFVLKNKEELIDDLRALCHATFTAGELISIVTGQIRVFDTTNSPKT